MTQVGEPSFHIGKAQVRIVSDGKIPTKLDVLRGIDRQKSAFLAGLSDPEETIELPLNCFLFEADGKPSISDTGAGTFMGTDAGHLLRNLRGAGVDPSDIAYIFLTHIHPDHSNGLTDDEGHPRFPNARLVLHQDEFNFWLKSPIVADTPERIRRGAERARLMVEPYADRIEQIRHRETFAGVTAIHQPGHTPGHTGWLLGDNGQQLLLWGDAVHLASVQIPVPEVGLIFDVDSILASRTRRQIFSWVAEDRVLVAGAHMAHAGYLAPDGNGFAFRRID